MVVAETREQAEDAAEAVRVEYEELRLDRESRRTRSLLVLPQFGTRRPTTCSWTRFSAIGERTDRAFAAADHVVGDGVPRRAHHAAALGAAGGPCPLRRATPAATRFTSRRAGLESCVRSGSLPPRSTSTPERLRLVAYDTGGNFGAKNRPYVEHGLALWASRKLNRPIKYRATRHESMLTEYQGRDLSTKVELALRADGRFLAMRAENVMNVGAHCVSLSPLAKGAGLITGAYDIAVATLRARAVFTNTVPNNVMRSSGRPEVTFAIERLIDTAATELGFDRIELRRKNLIRPEQMPYTNAVGSIYDSGTFEANMDLVHAHCRLGRLRNAAPPGGRTRGRLLGLGFANYVESSTGSPKERAEITVTRGGPRRGRHRHPAERPRARNQLCAGRRPICWPCRSTASTSFSAIPTSSRKAAARIRDDRCVTPRP